MQQEIWKCITEFPEYEVSSLGRVRRDTRVLCPSLIPADYPRVTLCVGGTLNYRLVHRLVAEAFIPNPESKPQVNHRNAVKHDNRVENLEWCSASENQDHAYRLGLKVCGEADPRHKLTIEEVREIRQLRGCVSQRELARRYKISQTQIWAVQTGKNWRYSA